MPSLVDIFNPSFFMFLGVLVLVAALLVVYFESKMREQNHKMSSMLNLITCMAAEMNTIKINLINQPSNNSIINPSSLETNNTHVIKHELIQVSDDESDTDSENSNDDSDSESESELGQESESESDSDSDSDSEEIKNVIEIGGDHNDIKVLKLNLPSLNEIDEDKNDLEDLGDLGDLDDLDDLDDIVSVDINEDIEEQNNNEKIDISDLNLKTINISNL